MSASIELEREQGLLAASLGKVGALVARAACVPTYPAVAKLTLLMLAVYSDRFWGVRVPVVFLCVYGILYERVLLSYGFWFTVTLILMGGSLSRAYEIDNHKVLTVYWCLVLTLCFVRPVYESLRFNARMLIGFCFAMSVVWKVVSPDFASGAFFEHTLLLDKRFQDFVVLVTGMAPEAVALNIADHEAVRVGSQTEMFLRTTPLVEQLAFAMALWTLFIESAIALAFLARRRWVWLHKARNGLLMLFMLTTYPVATVIGFGWLLCIMGFAQCRFDERGARLGYLVSMGILQLFLIPWDGFANLVFRLL